MIDLHDAARFWTIVSLIGLTVSLYSAASAFWDLRLVGTYQHGREELRLLAWKSVKEQVIMALVQTVNLVVGLMVLVSVPDREQPASMIVIALVISATVLVYGSMSSCLDRWRLARIVEEQVRRKVQRE